MDRRPLAAGVNAVPNSDPDLVRDFITQDRRAPTPKPEVAELPAPAERMLRSLNAEPPKRRRTKPAGVTPVGLIPVTVRLRPELAGALKRASLERQLTGDELFTQQDIVQSVLEPWLRQQGFLA